MPPADAILPGQGPAADAKSLSTLYADLLERARGLDQPGERSMACERVARSAIFTSHFDEAHAALVEAREAAMREPDQLVREQRILACVTSLLSLAEALVRDGMADESQFAGNKPQPGRTLQERLVWLQNAEGEWERAADLTLRLSNPNFRTQIMYQVVDSQAIGSQTIANQVLRASVAQSNLVSQADRLNTEADRALVLAARHARLIERPIWRDRALVAVAGNAANSNQFRRGLAIARTIPQPEVRTDGLIRIAEAQARRNFNEAATETYTEAARAVASIPQTDPRVILAGVLIDSLVAVGRFDDARESVIFYPDYSHQVLALGAIAESQGARGQSEAARDWIARSGPAEYRPYLYRRVNDGILAAVDKSRSTELTNEGYQQRP